MTMNPKEWWVATIVGIALSLAASTTVFADWSGVMDFFKSKSSEVMEGDGLSKAAEAAGLSQDQIAEGLKEALSKGAQSAVENLGKPDGFLDNAKVKIPMPEHLSMVEKG